MNTANLIDLSETFAEETKINQMAGEFVQEVSQVIYVDFKRKEVTKVVTTENTTGETQVEETEDSFPFSFMF